ncbi:PepSY domain-containing protein [Prosthecomicrobium sp. N25]|uniref:PepSY domain-containing protein n=1 Tax=Prosthecomicrobium sp. N25 TaxID=3129254 RepID=UPI003078806F
MTKVRAARVALLVLLAGLPAVAGAQTPAAQAPATPPTGAAPPVDRTAPPNPPVRSGSGQDKILAPGANSFTEQQARDRLASRGFADVSGLSKDQDGIWRGHAVKDGRTVSVAIDYQGNVAAE